MNFMIQCSRLKIFFLKFLVTYFLLFIDRFDFHFYLSIVYTLHNYTRIKNLLLFCSNAMSCDPELFKFDLLHCADVERLLNTCVEQLSESIHVSPSLAKTILQSNNWAVKDVEVRYRRDPMRVLVDSRIRPSRGYPLVSNPSTSSGVSRDRAHGATASALTSSNSSASSDSAFSTATCPVCFGTFRKEEVRVLGCFREGNYQQRLLSLEKDD